VSELPAVIGALVLAFFAWQLVDAIWFGVYMDHDRVLRDEVFAAHWQRLYGSSRRS
jgi:hypothetical protein